MFIAQNKRNCGLLARRPTAVEVRQRHQDGEEVFPGRMGKDVQGRAHHGQGEVVRLHRINHRKRKNDS